MAPRTTRSWQVIRKELPIDEARVAAYRRIIDAQQRIVTARARQGVTDAEVDAALEACEPENPESLGPRDLYLTTIERFVTALGGHLDTAAVFGEERIDLPGSP